MGRQTLGRGLSALLGEDTGAGQPIPTASEIDIHLIKPNPEQPRTRFAETALEELAKLISPAEMAEFRQAYEAKVTERLNSLGIGAQ